MQMKQKARLDSASEITSPYDAIQLNLKGVVEPMAAEEASPFLMCAHTLELSTQKNCGQADRRG